MPEEVDDLLIDPLSVAVWFMDDGGRGGRTPLGMVLNTSSFSEDDCWRLIRSLERNFEIGVNLHRVGQGFQLYVRRSSAERFVELVQPYLIDEMRYKLPVTP